MFTGAHLHLLVNHSPIFGSLFALALLIASYFTSADIFRRTAFVVLIATAIGGAAADLSGDAAEEAVKGLPGIKRELIDAHSQMGDKAYILAGILGVLALIALVRWRREALRWSQCWRRRSSAARLFTRGFSEARFATPRCDREPPRQTRW